MRPSVFIAATIAVLAVCSCNKPPGNSAPAGGTLVIATLDDPGDMFPPLIGEQVGRLITDQVFDRLAEIKPEMQTVGDKVFTPRLAKSWTWAPDSMSIAFSLDPRARWHDGKPVVASDVRYSFRVFTDSAVGSPVAPLLSNIDSVSVRDSLTPVVWFKRHTPEQFYDVAYQLVIVPEHVYGSIAPKDLHTSPVTRHPIGSGRFRFARFDPGVRVELIADTANYRGRPKLDRILLTPLEPTVAAAKILSGEADFLEAFPIDNVPALDTSKVAGPLIFRNFSYVFMGMNPYDPKSRSQPHPIFGDARVRRAFTMAVDRQAVLQNVFGNTGRISHGPFPMTVGYADSTLRVPPFDTTAAKAMLDSAGWRLGSNGFRAKAGRPLRFTLLIPTTSLFRQKYGTLLQEQFRKIGAQVDIDIVDGRNVFQERRKKGTFDAIMDSFSADPGPSGMKQQWTTAGIALVRGEVSGQNVIRYANPKVDALIDSATLTFDLQKSKAYAARASQAIIDDVPAVFLYDVVLVYALNRRVQPANLRPDEWWADLAEWSIPPDKQIERDRIGLTPAKR
jgi:peptide/nickel transport system substrate-binding protein